MAIKEKGFVTSADRLQMEGGIDPTYGNVTWKTFLTNDKTNTSELTLGVGYLPAEGILPRHTHTPPEFYYFLYGKGVVSIDDDSFIVSKGTVVYIPGDAPHSIKAHEDLSFLYGFAQHSFTEIEYVFSDLKSIETSIVSGQT